METTKKINPMSNSDNASGRRAVEDCFGLPTIVRLILEQFSDKELIHLSLVNKLWNLEARTLLRDRGCLKAKISSRPTCPSLVDFASDLEQMPVVPFTGIHVDLGHVYDRSMRFCCLSTTIGSLDPSYQVILDRLPSKHLSVHFPFRPRGSKDCPLFVLLMRILENCCGWLQDLSILSYESNSTQFIQTIFQSWRFPCLKTFKHNDMHAALPSDLAKALVSSAPSLKKLYVSRTDRISFMENVLEGSSAELLVPRFNPLANQVCESLIGALRTEIMVMRHGWGFSVELLNRFVPMALQAFSKTLKTLELDLIFAVPLMCYGICMENVTDLSILASDTTLERFQPDIVEILKGFDFTRVFPKLDKVTIADDGSNRLPPDVVSAFLGRGKVVLRMNFPHRAINIRQLDLKKFHTNAPPLPLLRQMFPHVQTLSVKVAEQEFPFTLLWQHFGCLAELHVDFQGPSLDIAEHLDSVFCGIFPEEVAELRVKDDEYLKSVHIVPVMPSITCLRDLRLITLQYTNFACNSITDSTRLFSKVTGLIGFHRCPSLSVKLQTPHNVLDHMRPYVTSVN